MTTHWMLKTQGDPLATARQFLRDLFHTADLSAMLVPLRMDDPTCVEPHIIDSPAQLGDADPFAPSMALNAARLVTLARQSHPEQQFAAVLRPCEIRALFAVGQRADISFDCLLIVGVDCVGTFSREDLAWRGSIDRLTREALQFARQGGVAGYRYRPACQMCVEPMPSRADLTIDLLGMAARQMVMIGARDEALATQVALADITDGPAPPDIVAQHERVQTALTRRHQRTRQRLQQALSTDLTMSIDALVDHLAGCQPCQKCLEACVIYTTDQKLAPGQPLTHERVMSWLASCAGCGMCEQACPEHLPLASIFSRLHDELQAILDETPAAMN